MYVYTTKLDKYRQYTDRNAFPVKTEKHSISRYIYIITEYTLIDRDQRKCILCNLNDIEDEFHFVLKCPYYNDVRNALIPNYYRIRPNMFKFIKLLNSSNKTVLRKLAMYCLTCFKIRENVIYM